MHCIKGGLLFLLAKLQIHTSRTSGRQIVERHLCKQTGGEKKEKVTRLKNFDTGAELVTRTLGIYPTVKAVRETLSGGGVSTVFGN